MKPRLRNLTENAIGRWLLAIVLLLTAFASQGAIAVAAEDVRPFPGTDKQVRGEFLQFYEANGGEAIFGLPLTDEIQENGRAVQYFSKSRFEAWPENPAGYRVQLGLLAAQMGKVQPPVQAEVSAGDPQRRFFPETGHVLAFGFKDFWETRGGLDIFGYPTTEQLVENGLIVQYTQRARLEWHPESAAGQQIVLGDIGREYLGMSAPQTQPTAAASDLLLFHQGPGGDIYTVKPDGSELRKVAHGIDPSWSPDRTQIIWASWDYPWGIYTADPDGSNVRLVYHEQLLQSPRMSPDGRFIAFTQGYRAYRMRPVLENGRYLMKAVLVDLWRVGAVDVQSGQVHQVEGDDESNSPSWAPDGRLVYAVTQGFDVLNQIYTNREVTHLAGTDPRYWSPSWSPVGTTLAFMWKQNDHFEIATMNTDGGGFRLVTSSPLFSRAAENVAPSWSPDGKSLAFLSNRTGKWQIWTMNADGSNQRMVPTGDLVLDYQFQRERPVSWGY